MQADGRRHGPLRVLTDVFVPDEGPCGVGAVATNGRSATTNSVYEQCFGPPEDLYLRSVLHALQLGKDLGADRIRVLCPDEATVRIVNRELPLEPGSPLAPTYMRIRALIYTYADAEIRTAPKARVRLARNLAAAASRMPRCTADHQYELFALTA